MSYRTEYLGDGVYATSDGFHVWVDCRGQTNLSKGPDGFPGIALERSVLKALVEFADHVEAKPWHLLGGQIDG